MKNLPGLAAQTPANWFSVGFLRKELKIGWRVKKGLT